jgi:hypothetical protein
MHLQTFQPLKKAAFSTYVFFRDQTQNGMDPLHIQDSLITIKIIYQNVNRKIMKCMISYYSINSLGWLHQLVRSKAQAG